jgi:hypothetical protein
MHVKISVVPLTPSEMQVLEPEATANFVLGAAAVARVKSWHGVGAETEQCPFFLNRCAQ